MDSSSEWGVSRVTGGGATFHIGVQYWAGGGVGGRDWRRMLFGGHRTSKPETPEGDQVSPSLRLR